MKHPLTVGFDPDTSDLHPFLQKQFNSTPIESFLNRWYEAVIKNISDTAHSIKLQSAFFEQFGPAGFAAMKDITQDAKRRGIHVLLDAKRGDISTTMAAYGRFAFDAIDADSLTILPWMGTDSLRALLPWMKQGKGVYVVWLSSNKSGRDVQMHPKNGMPPVARAVFEAFYDLAASENVTSQIGWVLGATAIPSEFINALPADNLSFLLPGIGAQGASFGADTRALTEKHPSSLFPVSRGILKPAATDDIHDWDSYSRIVEQKWNGLINDWTASLR